MEYSTNFKEKFLDIMVQDKIPVRKVILHFKMCMHSLQQWKFINLISFLKKQTFLTSNHFNKSLFIFFIL